MKIHPLFDDLIGVMFTALGPATERVDAMHRWLAAGKPLAEEEPEVPGGIGPLEVNALRAEIERLKKVIETEGSVLQERYGTLFQKQNARIKELEAKLAEATVREPGENWPEHHHRISPFGDPVFSCWPCRNAALEEVSLYIEKEWSSYSRIAESIRGLKKP